MGGRAGASVVDSGAVAGAYVAGLLLGTCCKQAMYPSVYGLFVDETCTTHIWAPTKYGDRFKIFNISAHTPRPLAYVNYYIRTPLHHTHSHSAKPQGSQAVSQTQVPRGEASRNTGVVSSNMLSLVKRPQLRINELDRGRDVPGVHFMGIHNV